MAQTTLTYTDEQYKQAAKDWSREFLLLPVMAIADQLKYFNGISQACGKVALPTMQARLQLAPYRADRKADAGLKYIFRQLETFLGSAETDFEPNKYRMLLRSQNAATLGEAQKSAPTVKDLIACGMQSIGESLGDVLFTARRNADGDTTADLFDGFDTIAENEIASGEISVDKGNLYFPDQEISYTNADLILKGAERSCDPVLRMTQKFLYCAPEIADMYDDAYLASHSSVPYNDKFHQPLLEGSGGKTTIVPMPSMSGLTRAYITPQWNMVYGYDNMGDLTRVDINRFTSFMLTLAATMFFGTQFYTLDKRVLKVIEFDLSKKPVAAPDNKNEGNQ